MSSFKLKLEQPKTTKIMNKSILLVIVIISCFSNMNAQEMNNKNLHSIIYTISDQVEGDNGSWRFVIDSTGFVCLTDELHNRMRVISPVANMDEVTDEQMRKCLEANFHTALDAKYAISDDILWATFIHPLKELTKDQVISGISQVYSCVKTFGTYYSSGILSFPTQDERKANQN